MLKKVSIIITTKNEADVIERLLKSIDSQTFENKEVILVDNNSTDNTLEIVQKNKKVRCFSCGPERSAQRNFGAKKAEGNFLLFLDADMELSGNVVKECVQEIIKDKKNGGVVIPEKSIASNFWEKVKAFERSFYNQHGDEITDAARFFSKEVFENVGGYDETITGPEDWDLPESIRKKGYKITRIKSIIYHYERIRSLFDLMKKKFYYGLASHRYLSKQKISTLSPKTVFFLRPVFYKQADKLIKNPILSAGLFLMLTAELVAGGLGYFVGRTFKK